ncbi:hypothetical protein BGX27_000372 [Mortierella sp. AM989]|nr:hypothetical protein BGX27_000372 [Mortierella sp. AM989]
MRTKTLSDVSIKRYCYTLWKYLISEEGVSLRTSLATKRRHKEEAKLFAEQAAVDKYSILRQEPSTSKPATSTTNAIAPSSIPVPEREQPSTDPHKTMTAESWKSLIRICINNITLLEQKDLFVALSGIVDTRALGAQDLTNDIEPLELESWENESKGARSLMDELGRYHRLGLGTLKLQCEIKIGQAAQIELLQGSVRLHTTQLLELILHLTTAIETGTQPISEAEWVAMWKKILEILSGGNLKFITGEHVCKATK